MTRYLNERRMKALTGAVDRALQAMIANANAAGWSTDEALAAIDEVVTKLKASNLVDPDPADDPEFPQEDDDRNSAAGPDELHEAPRGGLGEDDDGHDLHAVDDEPVFSGHDSTISPQLSPNSEAGGRRAVE